MQNYNWPGNVRELMNVIERVWITTKGIKLLLIDELKAPVRIQEEQHGKISTLEEIDREHIIKKPKTRNWKTSVRRRQQTFLIYTPILSVHEWTT